MNFKETINHHAFIITEGSVVERLKRNPAFEEDPHILNAAIIYCRDGSKEAMADIYRTYMRIGQSHGLPMIIYTPTWRANPQRLKLAGFDETVDVNRDCFDFLSRIRRELGDYSRQVFIGGLIGPRGNAYNPEESLTEKEAFLFHQWQLNALARAGVDFLTAQTVPAATEAVGIARAMAGFDLPYNISFVIDAGGSLLDGTPLHDIVARIDKEVSPAPLYYMVNCVHPSVFEAAMVKETAIDPDLVKRITALQANTSCKSPGELDNLSYLDTEAAEPFAAAMKTVQQRFGTKILGGCCGTDDSHIKAIASGRYSAYGL